MKKLLFLTVALAWIASVAPALTLQKLQQGQEDLVRLGEQNGGKAYAILKANFRFMKSDSLRLKELLTAREIKKCLLELTSLSSAEKVMHRYEIHRAYMDSIYPILIPYNAISGENISFALLIAEKEHYDNAQKEYLMNKALDMAHRLEDEPGLNLWDEEMDILKNTLTKEQLRRLFSIKHVRAAQKKLDAIWNKLSSEQLTTTLDSAKEWNRAYQYINEKMYINALYRHHTTERRNHLNELRKTRPLLIKMSDAYERKGRTDSARVKSADFEYVWTAYANGNENIDKAIQVLKGMDSTFTQSIAVEKIKSAAIYDKNRNAMNALGVVYAQGISVDKDSVQAKIWFELAGENGYYQAYHNLGMIYKYAKLGFAQDFQAACSYFRKGAEKGSLLCCYDYGFMLYKGLGCEQNYSEAVKYFKKGAEQLHIPSTYMLGLCYRNGFGVEQDIEKGMAYLHQADVLGYSFATEELNREYPENDVYRDVTFKDIPQSMPDVSADFIDIPSLSGEYEGVLVQYDWSGQYVLCEKPISLNIIADNNNVSGKLTVDSQDADFHAHITNDGRIKFSSGEIILEERYTGSDGVSYCLDNATFNVWSNKITGCLGLYSVKLKEPERPMYVEVYKKGSMQNTAGQNEKNISISPNPFYDQFTARFDLSEDIPNVEVRIFNRGGVLVYKNVYGAMEKGYNTLTIAPSINEGIYVLNIKAGKQTFRCLIAKKGGE